MAYILDEVMHAAALVGAKIKELEPGYTKGIRYDLARKYAGRGIPKAARLWEYLRESRSVQDERAWEWVKDYLQDRRVVMLFNEQDDPSALEFENGSDVVPVLAESFHFEFYLTDHTTDYLICFNHHDFLIATGAATDWLQATLADNSIERTETT